MGNDKIFLIWYTSMWDRLSQIPFLIQKKKEGKKIYLFEYENWYVNYTHKLNDIYSLLKTNDLYEWIITIPYNKIKLIFFMFGILFSPKKFKESYSPVKTIIQQVWWFLFSNKRTYSFKNNNDTSNYDDLVSWTLKHKVVDFYSFRKELRIPYLNNYSKSILKWKYITVYVWPYTWSLKIQERKKIFNYVKNLWYKIVLIWSNLNIREWWIENHIKKSDINFINLLWKTDFKQLCSIVSDADFTISANWWLMRLSHLLNKRSISFSIMSWYILHPPVNKKTSFHICLHSCPKPCERRVSEDIYSKYWMKKCIFKKTEQEWCCREIRWEYIMDRIKKCLANN
jgi:hypothetical protein